MSVGPLDRFVLIDLTADLSSSSGVLMASPSRPQLPISPRWFGKLETVEKKIVILFFLLLSLLKLLGRNCRLDLHLLRVRAGIRKKRARILFEHTHTHTQKKKCSPLPSSKPDHSNFLGNLFRRDLVEGIRCEQKKKKKKESVRYRVTTTKLLLDLGGTLEVPIKLPFFFGHPVIHSKTIEAEKKEQPNWSGLSLLSLFALKRNQENRFSRKSFEI